MEALWVEVMGNTTVDLKAGVLVAPSVAHWAQSWDRLEVAG